MPPTPTFPDRVSLQAALRMAFLESGDDEQRYYMLLNDEQTLDLASGFVPAAVKAMAMTMLDWQRQDQLRARRPEPKKTRGTSKTKPRKK